MTDQRRKLRIAIVEDDCELLLLIERLLGQKGMQVCFAAHGGDEAIRMFAVCLPDIVIMDYRMPTMNGLQATEDILRIKPETQILFLSADVEVKEESLKAGAAMFMKKPASIKDICRAIDTMADNIQLHAASASDCMKSRANEG